MTTPSLIPKAPCASKRGHCVERFMRRFWWPALWREIALLEKIQYNACRDWAEDHTHLQNLCREVGCTEYTIEGDSFGVPGIIELGDALRKRIPPNGGGLPPKPAQRA